MTTARHRRCVSRQRPERRVPEADASAHPAPPDLCRCRAIRIRQLGVPISRMARAQRLRGTRPAHGSPDSPGGHRPYGPLHTPSTGEAQRCPLGDIIERGVQHTWRVTGAVQLTAYSPSELASERRADGASRRRTHAAQLTTIRSPADWWLTTVLTTVRATRGGHRRTSTDGFPSSHDDALPRRERPFKAEIRGSNPLGGTTFPRSERHACRSQQRAAMMAGGSAAEMPSGGRGSHV